MKTFEFEKNGLKYRVSCPDLRKHSIVMNVYFEGCLPLTAKYKHYFLEFTFHGPSRNKRLKLIGLQNYFTKCFLSRLFEEVCEHVYPSDLFYEFRKQLLEKHNVCIPTFEGQMIFINGDFFTLFKY